MRFGLVGTGYWARTCHARALAAAPNVEFAGVWGRSPGPTRALAEEFGVRAFDSVDDLLASVDAVSFAVPPDVQGPLAARAGAAGKHLLLDKPAADRLDVADRVASAVAESGAAALVFHTSLFQPEVAAWVDEAEGQGWEGATAEWICSPLADGGSPYLRSGWRWSRGATWDVGPHALSLVLPLLGPVVRVQAAGGRGDLVAAVMEHESGALTSLSWTLRAPQGADRTNLELWGAAGRIRKPDARTGAVDAMTGALTTLVAIAEGRVAGHRSDLRFGREVVRILSEIDERVGMNRG
ncbi:Gfo/Idh/MocA family protein [Naasia aerilata]|uniref:Oxidoreductase n=1 Tax=Naasia aerilata TaxID=1162966 RepID=A0ABM8GBG4_9MICO|nr:Gfo/Idh/MocA family oxidoreductase [Naasia aerilata]BDZ45573.1 oxidoreductase [Naasia aerilata]